MISRTWWRMGIACLLFAIAVGLATETMMAQIRHFLDEQVELTAGNLREIVLPVVERIPENGGFGDLHRVMATPSLKGIEVFGSGGRRIWHAGESLEIVGYRFEEQNMLTHIAADNTRYEVFWSANALQGDHGVALRLDTQWQEPIRRRMIGLTLLLSFGLVVTGISISRGLLERGNMTAMPPTSHADRR